MLIELYNLFKYNLIVEGEITAPAEIIAHAEAPSVETPLINPKASSHEDYLKLENRPEVTPKEQDVSLTTLAIIGRKGNSFLQDKESDPGLLKQFAGKTEGPILLFSYLLRPDFKGIQLSEGLKVVVAEDGTFSVPQAGKIEGRSIRQIFSRDGQSFSCDLGDEKQTLIPIATVLSADIVSIFTDEKTTQKLIKDGLFTPQEIQTIQAYVDSVTGKGSASAEGIDGSIMKEIALSNGLPRAESIRSFLEKNGQVLRETDVTKIEVGSDEEKVKISEENKKHNEKVQEILKLLDGRVVASPETVATVIQTILPEQVEPLKSLFNEEMIKIKLEMENLKDSSASDPQKIKDLSIQQNRISQILLSIQQIEGISEFTHTAVMGLFSSVQRGEIGVETTQAFEEGIIENNPEKIITALLAPKNVDEDTKAEVKGFLAKHGKTIGKFSLLAALGLMYALMKSGKEQPQYQ